MRRPGNSGSVPRPLGELGEERLAGGSTPRTRLGFDPGYVRSASTPRTPSSADRASCVFERFVVLYGEGRRHDQRRHQFVAPPGPSRRCPMPLTCPGSQAGRSAVVAARSTRSVPDAAPGAAPGPRPADVKRSRSRSPTATASSAGHRGEGERRENQVRKVSKKKSVEASMARSGWFRPERRGAGPRPDPPRQGRRVGTRDLVEQDFTRRRSTSSRWRICAGRCPPTRASCLSLTSRTWPLAAAESPGSPLLRERRVDTSGPADRPALQIARPRPRAAATSATMFHSPDHGSEYSAELFRTGLPRWA